jgi:hypothetical protein
MLTNSFTAAKMMLGRHVERLQQWNAEEEIENFLRESEAKEA